jgi:HTH-type transcriptional regulator / antitoxin HigA
MARNKWIEPADSVQEQAHNALAFFGVPSIDGWRQTYEKTLKAAAYRSSSAYEVHPGAEAAWLRQGEIQARAIDCVPWNRDTLLGVLPKVRELTRESDPAVFVPKLEALCAAAGVALVIARAPEGCRASGATKFIREDKALMLLSFRYLSDDQFWFTVFHEVGHLVLHTHKGLFLEGSCLESADAEKEADEFAKEQLFPGDAYGELSSIPLNKFAIARFARRAGVASGIVVGQLQELGRIPHRHFNYMKARYSWIA